MRRPLLLLLIIVPGFVVVLSSVTRAHDIPNARVDRAIQVTLSPGRLTLDYEVSLSELTLSRDLRDLIGPLPDGDRQDLFQRYGQETGPLNAKGLLVSIDQRPLTLRSQGFDLATEEHPQFTFHFEAPLPSKGRLKIQDTNFVSSEGTSRLALRGRDGVILQSDSLPTDVRLISPQPLWMLSDLEERRSKQAELDFHTTLSSKLDLTSASALAPRRRPSHEATLGDVPAEPPSRAKPSPPRRQPQTPPVVDRLTQLLDRRRGTSLLGLVLIAFGLGAAHAVQPGHGKTLVAATVVAGRGSWFQGTLLALITTATHTGSVLLVALGLWLFRSSHYESVHAALTYCAGFAIASIGCWRLGRHLGGYGEHVENPGHESEPADGGAAGNLIGLGIAGGLVPCWDAVALILLAESVGHLRLGVGLVVAFGTGMASILVLVGLTAARFRRLLTSLDRDRKAEHWLGIAGSLVLCLMGLYLLRLA